MRPAGPSNLNGRLRADPAALRHNAWRWLLAWCGIPVAVYLALRLGDSLRRLLTGSVFLLVVVVSFIAVIVGIRWYRPAHPAAWWLIVAGFAVALIAEAQDHLRPPERFPSYKDGWYLLVYLLFAAGMLVMARARIARGSRAAVLDALIVTISLGLVALRFVVFPYLVEPFLSDPALSLAGRAAAIAYLIGDLLLLAVAVLLVAGGKLRPAPLVLLLLAVGLQVLDDTVSTAIMIEDGGTFGAALLSSYALIGAAALHPSMRALTERVPARPPELGRARVAVLVIAAVLAPLLVEAAALREQHPVLAAIQVSGTILLAILVYARISGLSESITAQAARDQRLLDQAVRAKEDERLQVAADLHDGPIQRLSAMGLTIELARRRLERHDDAGVARLLEQLNGELGEEVMSLRRVMVELHSPVLDEWGIREALYACAADYQQRTGIDCAVRADATRALDRSRETIIYRVTQEALTNVARHARARNVWIDLSDEDSTVELTIRDDGAGFDAATLSEVVEREHFGLAGIRRRVELGGGSCAIHSKPGTGTIIRIRLPAAGAGPNGHPTPPTRSAGREP